MSVPDLLKFLPGVSEIWNWWEWEISEVTVTSDHQDLISSSLKKFPKHSLDVVDGQMNEPSKNIMPLAIDNAGAEALETLRTTEIV